MSSAGDVATEIDAAVIGGGVAGLACALSLARHGLEVVLLEREPGFGQATSTHNSGVIHAGLYYPEGSLKARLCVEGRDRLYAFCVEHNIPHNRVGKLVIAHDDGEIEALEALHARSLGNGVTDVALVDRSFIKTREPYADGVAALWSPSTGIVEPEALVRSLARLAKDDGAHLLPG